MSVFSMQIISISISISISIGSSSMLWVLPQELRLVHRPQQGLEEGLGEVHQAALRGILEARCEAKRNAPMGRENEEFLVINGG